MSNHSSNSGWTMDTLLVHVTALLRAAELKNQQQFADQDKAVRAALAEQEQAVGKAEINAEKWRANANEWRAAMTDRERNFAPIQRVDSIEHRLDRMEGKGLGVSAVLGYLVGVVGLVAALVSMFHKW